MRTSINKELTRALFDLIVHDRCYIEKGSYNEDQQIISFIFSNGRIRTEYYISKKNFKDDLASVMASINMNYVQTYKTRIKNAGSKT